MLLDRSVPTTDTSIIMKIKHTLLAAAAVLGLCTATPCFAQESEDAPAKETVKLDPETRKLVKDVMDASQVKATLEKSVDTMIEQGKKAAGANPNIPPEFWIEVEKEFRKKLPELVESMMPVYAEHFTKSELVALAEFYKSPAGKKFAEKQPEILQASMTAGAKWGEKIGREVMQRLMSKKETD